MTELQEAWVPARVREITGTTRTYANSRYQVFVRDIPSARDGPKLIHLSIKRNDKEAIRDWRDLQRIKNETCGSEWEGMELYPAESRLVDNANQTHLWVFEPPFKLPWGFSERCVSETSAGSLAKQRPFELRPPDLEDGKALLDRQAQIISGAATADEVMQDLTMERPAKV